MSTTTTGVSRRALSVAILAAAVVAVMVDPGPAQAATIPKPPAACNPVPEKPGNPVITSVTRSPATVDVTHGKRNVTFTIKAKDAKNITSVFVELISPSIGIIQEATGNPESSSPVSGTRKNGTWKVTVPFDQWSIQGAWDTDITLSDAGGAYLTYSSSGGGDKPWHSTWPKTVHVISHQDIKAPTVHSLTLSSSSVDTSTANKKIKVTLEAEDNLSGIDGPITVSAFRDVGDREYFTSVDLLRTSGTANAGTWKGSLTVPRWVGSGTHSWQFSIDHAFDRVGNVLTLDSNALHAKHLPSTIKVKSETDATKPVLTNVSFSAASVDARTKDKTVDVTVSAYDTHSGVASGFAELLSPSGDPTAIDLTKAGAGTWKGTLLIPQCSEPGIWTLDVGLFDHANNTSQYAATQIKAKGLPSTLTVKALDVMPPDVRLPSHQPHAGPVVLTFTEPTLWKGSINPITVFDTTGYTGVAGTWTCKNTGGATVGCNANNADVKTASFAPSSPLTVGRKYEVHAAQGIYDTSGNGPMLLDKFFKAT